jgi:uncharacterized protein
MIKLVSEKEEQRYAELQNLALDAARVGDTELLASMIQAGMPVNLQDLKGNTLLMLATYHGNVGTVTFLLEHKAEPDRRNLRNQTPLGGVAFKGYAEIAALLLDHGADLNADQGGGTTPLMLASLFGRTEMERLLQQRGANTKTRNRWGLSSALAGRFSRFVFKILRLIQRNSQLKPSPRS